MSFLLKLLNRDFTSGMRLQLGVELIVFRHRGFAVPARHTGTEFLEVHADPVESETAAAVGTFNSGQCLSLLSSCGTR